ncbi:MAG TPA: pentapeptide repeat-containing protein [Geobacteraceae bacterium]|nr:pentapeptide repeat-containing protein [Geobacteraceae bacterium]
MRHFVCYIIVAGVVLATATAAFPASPTPAAKDNIKENTIVSAKPAEKTTAVQTPAEKTVVKKSRIKDGHKSRRASRRQISADRAREAEAAPGERLSIRQVMELLKTTRNFAGKNLSGLRLVAFDLTKCNLKGANLSNANLQRADLEESNLELADLSGANMKMTDLRITGLRGAKLDHAIFDGALWQDGTVCAKGSTGFCRERSDQFAAR